MKGFGGMVTFLLRGGIDESRAFLENLHIFHLAESLGATESLVDHPYVTQKKKSSMKQSTNSTRRAIMTHAAIPVEERAKLGISDSLCRLSVGLEDVEDLIHDLSSALDAVPPTKNK